jgi:fibronectin-binding autotransporter adhesin
MQSRKKVVAIFAAINAMSFGASIVNAADYTWISFNSATYLWSTEANWSSGGPGTPAYPNQPNDSANIIGAHIGGALTINLPTNASVTTLSLGDTAAVPTATTIGSTGGTLIFDPAALIISGGTAGASNIITAPIQLNNNLSIGTTSTNGLALGGFIQPSGAARTITNSIPTAAGQLLNTGTTLLYDASAPLTSQNITFAGTGTTIHSGRFVNGDGTTTGATGRVTFNGGVQRITAAQPNLTASAGIAGGTVIAENDLAFGTAFLAISGGSLQSNSDTRTLANNVLYGGNWTLAGNNSLTITGWLQQNNNRTVTNNLPAGKALSLTGTLNGVAVYCFEFDSGDHHSANPPNRYFTVAGTGDTVITGRILPSPADITVEGPWPAAYHIRKQGNGVMTIDNATTNSQWFRTQLQGGVLLFGAGDTMKTTSIELDRGGGVWKSEGSASPEFTTMVNLIAPTSTGAIALPASEAATNFSFAAGDLAGRPEVAIGAFGNLTYTGTVTPGTAGYNWGGGTGTLTLNGNDRMTGANNVRYANGTKIIVTGNQSYTGRTQLDSSATLEVNSIPNGGVASQLGASTADAANLYFSGGALRYIGAGQSTDRAFTLGGKAGAGFTNGQGAVTGATIDASGTGALNLTATGNIPVDEGPTAGARTLTLTGTGTGSLAANVVNGGAATVSLTKAGSGQWTVAGTNTYTGTTTVSAGTLLATNPSSFGTGTLNVTGGRAKLNNGFATAMKLPVVTIGNAGVVDIGDNDMVIDYPTGGGNPTLVDTVRQHLLAGRLTSSSNGTPAGSKVGYGDNFVLHKTSFGGITVDDDMLLIKFTYGGDTDLNGQVDVADLGSLATNWQTANVWTGGDFDYNGTVDVNDLGILATNWQNGVGNPLGPGSFQQALESVGLGSVAVPEPAAIGLLLPMLLGCRRRNR